MRSLASWARVLGECLCARVLGEGGGGGSGDGGAGGAGGVASAASIRGDAYPGLHGTKWQMLQFSADPSAKGGGARAEAGSVAMG